MSEGRWRITVTPPDWGQDHLSSDAIVAYVDDELAQGPHERATQHIAGCAECEAQVRAQGQTRSALRTAGGPVPPSTLLSTLRSIPESAELPPPPAGLAVTPDGQFVSVLRPQSDILALAGAETPPADHGRRRPPSRSPVQRRIRLGTGVAVSGLALGALAYGLPPASTDPGSSTSGPFGGSVLGGGTARTVVDGPGLLDAQMRLERAVRRDSDPDPGGTDSDSDPGITSGSEFEPDLLEGRLDVVPGSFIGMP
ncbi:anti-sigma factor family protein [Pseudonocardia xinjiangensis]|uniref:anti-sigma factor family protein n=1 Tax=Pseudonocardia xinjiangensis TaxID=75289 RepID=UPI003D8A0372